MLDFDTVVRILGSEAVRDYCVWMDRDDKALEALATSDVEGICNWLTYYGAFRGYTSKQRNDISAAIVIWAKRRNPQRDLSSPHLLDEAHKEMSKVCVAALGKDRQFTSLASKALWLCYPQQVPIFDSLAFRALLVLSQLEEGIKLFGDGLSPYGQFAHIWQHFFHTYRKSIDEVGMHSCRYPVRILDVILLRVGNPKLSVAPRQAGRELDPL